MATKDETLAELYEQLKDWAITDKRYAKVLERIRQLEDHN